MTITLENFVKIRETKQNSEGKIDNRNSHMLAMAKGAYVYIVSNKSRTVLYIGVTANLYARIFEHKAGNGSVFTKKYHCTDLLYYEFHSSIEGAIQREKQLKKWKRSWKEELIQSNNPTLKDLYNTVEEMQ